MSYLQLLMIHWEEPPKKVHRIGVFSTKVLHGRDIVGAVNQLMTLF